MKENVMDEQELFGKLKNQSSATLLELLQAAYDEMNTKQRRAVFGEFSKQSKPSIVDAQKLLKAIKQFHKESLSGMYYAPFEINSKNFMHIPEETDEWFHRIAELLEDSSKLTNQGDHSKAVQCFKLLYELIEAIDDGEEIVFADELGSWMIPGDDREFTRAYITSLAATATAEEFTSAVIPLLKRDSFHSFTTKAYSVAMRAANKEQRDHLKAEVERENVRTQAKT